MNTLGEKQVHRENALRKMRFQQVMLLLPVALFCIALLTLSFMAIVDPLMLASILGTDQLFCVPPEGA